MSRSNNWMTLNVLADRLRRDRRALQTALAAAGLLDPDTLTPLPDALLDGVARLAIAHNGQPLVEWHSDRVRAALAAAKAAAEIFGLDPVAWEFGNTNEDNEQLADLRRRTRAVAHARLADRADALRQLREVL